MRLKLDSFLGRLALVVLIIGAIAIPWNIYISNHNGGLVSGFVTDASGRPIPKAIVRLSAVDATMYSVKDTTETDQAGKFAFNSNASHRIQVDANKEGVGRSERVTLWLYFRGQNVELEQPLVIR